MPGKGKGPGLGRSARSMKLSRVEILCHGLSNTQKMLKQVPLYATLYLIGTTFLLMEMNMVQRITNGAATSSHAVSTTAAHPDKAWFLGNDKN